MQDPKETFNNIEQNTEMALLQSEKIAESVDNLEPIMEGVLLKTDEMVQEMKKNNDKPINETKIIFEGVEMTEIRGRDGKDGEKGDKGDTGIQGSKGEKGDKGDHGEKGDKGEDGTNGYDGRDGLDGYDGKDGQDGIDGRDGIDGKDGKDGTEIKPEEIKQKLESLEVGLDYEKLSNVPDIAKIARMASSKTVSLKELDDVDYSGLTQTNGKYVLGGSGLTSVEHDSTLTGDGTTESPLSVVATSASDVAITVRAATTAALAGTWTYDNGTSGVGATLTRTTNGALPNQDGVSLSDGDRILIKNQASTLVNGVYVLTQKGVTSVSPTIFTRATDADETSELDELVVTISEGSTNRGTVWGQQTNNPVVGTSAIVFATVVSTAVTQATSGTQAINQIPLYTGTARQLTRGTANFKYNPTTDLFTIRGIDYTFPANNGDASQVLTTDGSGNLTWTTPAGGSSPITIGTSGNTLYSSGLSLTGQGDTSTGNNIILGEQAGRSSNAYQAIFLGQSAGRSSSTANNSIFLGQSAGFGASKANNSIFLGQSAGQSASVGANNSIFIGNSSGINDTVDNSSSGSSILIGDNTSTGGFKNSIAIGAGATNTAVNQLMIGSGSSQITSTVFNGSGNGISESSGTISLGNLSGGNNTKIIIEDVTQLITVSNVPTYADDAAATTGGLTTGQLYKTTTGGITALNIVP